GRHALLCSGASSARTIPVYVWIASSLSPVCLSCVMSLAVLLVRGLDTVKRLMQPAMLHSKSTHRGNVMRGGILHIHPITILPASARCMEGRSVNGLLADVASASPLS